MQRRIGQGTYVRARDGLERQSRMIASILVGSFFLLALVWFIFVSRYWSISKIEIEGLKELGRGEVESVVFEVLDNSAWKPWDRRSIFFLDEKRIAENIRQKLLAENVVVEKSYPNILRLILTERQRRVVYVIGDQFFDLDTQGHVTGIDQDQGGHINDRLRGKAFADASHPVIVVQSIVDEFATSTVTSTQGLVDADSIRRWIEVNQALIASGLRFKVLRVMQSTARSFNLAVDKGYDVLMDFQTPVEPQIETYKRFIQTKPKNIVITEYVDVRVPGKIYLK